jgi:hypothetical protein
MTVGESHSDYPAIWLSPCRKYRIIRCVDDIQFIPQVYQSPSWRSLSFHVEWASIHFRWGEGCFGGLPDSLEDALQQRMEPDLDVLAMVLGK